MTTTKFTGQEVNLTGNFPKTGEKAPPFTLVSKDLKDTTLESFENKWKLLNIFPSLNTDVCSKSVHTFYEKCVDFENLLVLNISMDLPFAAAKYCSSEGLDHVTTLSAFRSSFGKDYGVVMADGMLKGLLARAVILLNGENQVVYTELVPEVTQEPDYEAVIKKITG